MATDTRNIYDLETKLEAGVIHTRPKGGQEAPANNHFTSRDSLQQQKPYLGQSKSTCSISAPASHLPHKGHKNRSSLPPLGRKEKCLSTWSPTSANSTGYTLQDFPLLALGHPTEAAKIEPGSLLLRAVLASTAKSASCMRCYKQSLQRIRASQNSFQRPQ